MFPRTNLDKIEVLSEDYLSGAKVKLSTKVGNGLSYTVAGKTTPKSDKLEGEFVIKKSILHTKNDQIQEVKLQAKLLSNTVPVAEALFEQRDALGQKFSVTLVRGESLATASTEILQSKIGISVLADILKSSASASVTTAVVPSAFEGFLVFGARGDFDLSKSSMSNNRFAASVFDGRESEINLEVEGKADACSLSYSHLMRPSTSFAATMRYSRASSSHTGTMGLVTRVDESSILKAKIDTSGQVGLAFILSAMCNTKIVTSTDFNVAKGNSPNFGLSVTVG